MLEVRNLTKNFGSLVAVKELSFTIKAGEILGLVGQNGSGKTTTFRMILNLMQPTSGEIFFDGEKLGERQKNIIGYLPEERGLYPKETIEQQVIYFGRLHGKTTAEVKDKLDYWMEHLQVKGKKTDKVKSLSKGNQQKVQLITTLIHEPKLVILDEPFSGLDPVNAQLMQEAIISLRQKGTCVIFSSHNMANVEQICDKLIMLKDGRQILAGQVGEIRESFGRIKVFLEANLTKTEVQKVPGVLSVDEQGKRLVVTLADPAVGVRLFELATKEGYIPTFSQETLTLEEIFKLKAGEPNEL